MSNSMQPVRALLLLIMPALAAGATAGMAQGVAGPPAALPAIDTLTLRADTRFLADDALAGRGTGSRGERVAAAYIASRLVSLGLRGAGADGGFMLPVPLRAARVDPATRIRVRGPTGDPATFMHGGDFLLNTGGEGAFRDFAGEVVFAGTPAEAGEALRGVELRGRVIAVVGPLGAHALDLMPAWIEAGVAGVVLLVPDAGTFDLYVRSRGSTRYFVAADVQDPVWQPALPVVIAGPGLSDRLLRAVSSFDGAALPLGIELDATVVVQEAPLPVANVAAVLPGNDPALRDEYVVYTAHYDHLGVGTPDAAGDSVYNGFSDNAAGVAMLLGIADALRDRPPARSVMFVFFTGEERGLLGSAYFAAHPPIPLEEIQALINLDAGAPPVPPVSWRIPGGAESELGALAEEVARERGWSVQLGPASPNSDYWPFARKGVPAVFIIPGETWEDTSTAERDALRQRWDRYHQPGDHYHPDFPFGGLQRYAEYALALGLRAGDG